MKITSVSYSGSNPSMGPHNSPSRRSLNMGPYQQELEALLDHTQVNGAASLREYLSLRLEEDQEGIRRVHESFDCGDLNCGQRIIDLVFELQGGPTIALNDLRRFSLTGAGYRSFDALIKAEGSVSSPGSLADALAIKEPAATSEYVVPEFSEAPRVEDGSSSPGE